MNMNPECLYEQQLNAEEVKTYLNNTKTAFEAVKENPYGSGKFRPLIRRLRGHLAPEHIQTLANGVGILFPLTLQSSVLQNKGEVHLRDIMELQSDILHLLSEYRNTGIKRVGGVTEDTAARLF